ncbi:hypothetical protein [Nafulsella turpanensis]|uniref:hypothetical protein n=1 Tax=Nafulsella turpanensis TaxID=1265690 RepID=UPI000348A6E8|nr:hypothetical protein [Nafulsella turpanensis]
MATYPTPYGTPKITQQNCTHREIYFELYGAERTGSTSQKALIDEGRRIRPYLMDSTGYHLGQFVGFKKNLSYFSLNTTLTSVDVYRNSSLIQDNLTDSMIWYDYESNPNGYTIQIRKADGTLFTAGDNYNLTVDRVNADTPTANSEQILSILDYASQSFTLKNDSLDTTNYSYNISLMLGDAVFGDCIGSSKVNGSLKTTYNGTFTLSSAEAVLFSTDANETMYLEGGLTSGAKVELYTRTKGTSNAWALTKTITSYAGEALVNDFNVNDYKVIVGGGTL